MISNFAYNIQPWKSGDVIQSTEGLRFEMLSILGRGGMGTVWLVKEINSNIQFALKSPQIHSTIVVNVDALIKKFYREAESWKCYHAIQMLYLVFI